MIFVVNKISLFKYVAVTAVTSTNNHTTDNLRKNDSFTFTYTFTYTHTNGESTVMDTDINIKVLRVFRDRVRLLFKIGSQSLVKEIKQGGHLHLKPKINFEWAE